MGSDAGDHKVPSSQDPNHDGAATNNGDTGTENGIDNHDQENSNSLDTETKSLPEAGEASPAAEAAAMADVSPHVALASSSSLVLPLTDPILSLDPDVSSVDELVAMLRGQITDLAGQVTSLNSKLVKSYTQRGEIEDDLHDTQEQHALLKMKVAELERDRERWTKEIEAGGWVEKTHVQGEMQRLMSTMVEETKSRESAVQAHAALETEIENLTSNLFTEANKMVAFERLARARAEEKTRSVEEAGISMQALLEEVQVGLKDTVLKLEDRDAQIADLKRRLAAYGEHVEEDENVTGEGSDEHDLGGIVFSDGEQLAPIKTRALTRSATGSGALSPSPMAAPRLLTSVLPYQEFLAFINYLRQTRIAALSRPPEQSSYPALGGRSFATDPVATAQLTPDQLLAPHLLLSTHLSQAFLKRCVEEDSDPALRLDIAPGLGFLSRRSVANAIVDGSLVIEPLHSSSELPSDKCALCGCGLDRWLANSGISKADRPVPTPAQTAAASVNSTMRKISSSFFSRSTSSAHVSPVATAAPPLPPRGSSATSTSDDSTAHPSSTAASHHPHDAFLLAHVFRTSDKSQSQRYPICPSYCLPRLRAVCEFWTYVRVLLRGLLLEESFRFGQIGEPDSATAPSTPARAKPTSGLGISDVHGSSTTSLAAEGPGADIQAKDFEAEDTHTDDGKGDDAAKTEDQDKDADAPAPPADEAGQEGQVPEIVTSTEEASEAPRTSTDEQKQDDGSDNGTAPGTPTSASASVSRSGSIKPPRPARSTARNSPKPPTAPSPPASPSPDKNRPALPARKAAPSSTSVPPPPPRRNVSHAPSAADSAISTASTMAAGWEDRCWNEVIRLKEAVFWTRVAALAAGGEAVSSRGARVWQ